MVRSTIRVPVPFLLALPALAAACVNEVDRGDPAARRPGAPVAAPFQARAPEPRPSRFRGLLAGDRFASCASGLEMRVEDRTGGELEREVSTAAGGQSLTFVEVQAWLRPAESGAPTAPVWFLEIHEVLRAGGGPEACADDLAIGELRAFGSEWSLDLRSGGVALRGSDGNETEFRAVEPNRTDTGIELRTIDASERLLGLTMSPAACRDPSSGTRYPYRAVVELEGERLEGCGYDRGGFSYAAVVASADTRGWLVTLSLEADGSAQLATDAMDGAPPIVESGNWYAEIDVLAVQLLSVATTEGPQPVDETLQFRITETGLEALGAFGFGASGWTLTLH